MSEDLDLCLEVAVTLAKEAGEIIRIAVLEEKRIEMKASAVDLVTETDQLIEKFLISGFKKQFPHHKFIGEESTAAGVKNELTDAPTWIIDPVDGTMNFVHSFPFVAVSIGLAINKKLEVGVIYNPLLEKLYTAKRGSGAHLNGEKIKVSRTTELSQSLVVMEVGSSREPARVENVLTNISTIIKNAHGVRSLGSAAMNICAVAAGQAEVYYEYGIHCWDMAAGAVIIEEAGGVVIDPEGGPFDLMSRRIICATSMPLALELSKILRHIQLERD